MRLHPNPRLKIFRNHGERGKLVAHVPQEKQMLEVTDWKLLPLLEHASGGADATELIRWFSDAFGISQQRAKAVCKRLDEDSIFLTKTELGAVEEEMASWQKFDWQPALEYYYTILGKEYADLGEASDDWMDRLNRVEADGRTRPTVYKEYAESDEITLREPSHEALGTLSSALDQQYTQRPIDERPMRKTELSTLLYYAFGEIEKRSIPTGEYLFKTSPSAGARHPTEAYVVAADVEDIERGVYHYSVAEHALEKLPTDPDEIWDSICDGNDDPRLVIIFSSVVYRLMMKYPSAHIFQAVNYDIGHLIATLELLCSGLRRELRFSDACDSSVVSDALGLNPLAEPIFGYTVVG